MFQFETFNATLLMFKIWAMISLYNIRSITDENVNGMPAEPATSADIPMSNDTFNGSGSVKLHNRVRPRLTLE